MLMRTSLVAHVQSVGQADALTRMLLAIPGIEQVVLRGFANGRIRFEVSDESGRPLASRLQDIRVAPWRVLDSDSGVELWLS